MGNISYLMLAGAVCLLAAAPAQASQVSLEGLSNGGLTMQFIGGATSKNIYSATGSCASGVSAPSGCEDSWLAGKVTSIYDQAGNVWQPGNGNYLGFVAYGISDIGYTQTGSNYTLYSDGATAAGTGTPAADGRIHVDIYQMSTQPSLTAGPAGRTSYGTYPGTTTGSPWLEMVLIPGITSNPAYINNATLVQNLLSTNSPTSGTGSFYADIVGGSAMSSYASHGFTTTLGTAADVQGNFTLASTATNDISAGVQGLCTPSTVNSPSCFEQRFGDPATLNKVPEPGTLGMLAGFLLMLGLAHRYAGNKRST